MEGFFFKHVFDIIFGTLIDFDSVDEVSLPNR